jgi:hypothetical protein
MPLPDAAGADLWIRQNITKVTDPETGEITYEANEAYMRTDAAEAVITSDLDAWFETASIWQPPAPPDKLSTPEERIATLEAENRALNEQLSSTMEAVDFLLFGGMEV